MDWKLELVVVPVADVERSKHFYGEQVGFVVDHDTRVSDTMRIVQLTPPGSGCSIAIGTGDMPPGSLKGLQLVVSDIDAARATYPVRQDLASSRRPCARRRPVAALRRLPSAAGRVRTGFRDAAAARS